MSDEMSVRSICIALTFILCMLSTNAEACRVALQWRPLTDSAANNAADAVFRGIVVTVTTPAAAQYPSSRTARLKVLQTLKGDTGPEIDVEYEQADGANCGRVFTAGENVWMRAKKLSTGGWAIIGAEGRAAPAVYLGTVENGFPRIMEKYRNQIEADRPVTTVSNFAIPFLDPGGPKIDPACLRQTADQYRWWRVVVDRHGKITRVRSFFSMNPAMEDAATSSARKILEAPQFRPGRVNNIPTGMEIVVADLDFTCGRSR